MSLNIIDRYATAIELLSLEARINIISDETGLSPKILRKAFVDMHKRSPPRGPLKFNSNFIYKSFSRTKEATLFVFFFRIEIHDDFIQRCINAYRRYKAYILTVYKVRPVFDFSDSWMIAKWSECGILKLVRCNHCRSAKLINNELQQNVCCVCKS
ncbi:MAG: hypothetical protein KGZ88_07495 [Methylomicrobium sp.]|nr:hypothetical protein [Methylomicrobium sp.]